MPSAGEPPPPTDDQIWALLRRLDDPDHIERPAGFDDQITGRRFDTIRQRLELGFGGTVHADGWEMVQDASHFGTLIVPEELTSSTERIVVTVSNFAPLVSVALQNPGVHGRSEFESLLDASDEQRLADSLGTVDAVVVPEELLWSAYDGTVGFLRSGTWWVRYFDYL